MRFFRKTPQEGKPLAQHGLSEGWRRLEEAFEKMEVVGGHLEWIKGYIPRIVIDSAEYDRDEPMPAPKTFGITQDGAGTITLVRCHYQRGSQFIETAYEPTVSISTGVLFAVVNTVTGEITAQIDFVNDPEQPELFGFALYHITASGDSQTATVDYETGVRVIVAYE